jgi:hypothetical protein
VPGGLVVMRRGVEHQVAADEARLEWASLLNVVFDRPWRRDEAEGRLCHPDVACSPVSGRHFVGTSSG